MKEKICLIDQLTHLHHAVRVHVRASAAVRSKRERALLVVHTLRFELVFRLPHRRDLGPRVNNARDRIIVDVPGLFHVINNH